MLLMPHTLAGIAIAASVPNPIISIPLSIIMHFVGDMIPHWDLYDKRTDERTGWVDLGIMLDLVLGVAFGIFFTLYSLWILHNTSLALNILACGIFSVLPDAIMAPALYIKNPPKISKIMFGIQKKLHNHTALPYGLITQLLVVLLCLLLISGSL